MTTTPRPWSWFPDARKDGTKVARIGGGIPEDDLGWTLKEEDANLIVTAVNSYDALVAKVAAYEAFVSGIRTERDTIRAMCELMKRPADDFDRGSWAAREDAVNALDLALESLDAALGTGVDMNP